MVNVSPTKPDFRASLIEALRKGLVVSSQPKTDDQLTESALDKLQYDFPDLTDEELACLLRGLLRPRSLIELSQRHMDVVREEAGRHEVAPEAAAQQHVYIQVLLVAVLNQLLTDIAKSRRQHQSNDMEQSCIELAKEVRYIVLDLLDAENCTSWDPKLRLLEAVRVVTSSAFSEAESVTKQILQAVLHLSSGLSSAQAAMLLQQVLSLLRAGGQRRAGSPTLWRTAVQHLPPFITSALNSDAENGLPAALSCVSWIAVHAVPTKSGTDLLADELISSGVMRGLVQRTIACPDGTECWEALLLVCCASESLKKWAFAAPRFKDALAQSTLSLHQALFLDLSSGDSDGVDQILEQLVEGNGSNPQQGALENLTLIANYRKARGAGLGSCDWTLSENQRGFLQKLQTRMQRQEETARADKDDESFSTKRPDGPAREARLASQRLEQESTACLQLLKELLLPAGSSSKKE